MPRRILAILSLAGLASFVLHVDALIPPPMPVSNRDPASSVALTIFDVPPSACAGRDVSYCVDNLGKSLQTGITGVLEQLFAKPAGASTPTYTAEFHFLSLSVLSSYRAHQLQMGWHFTLRDSVGKPALDLDEFSVDPRVMATDTHGFTELPQIVADRVGRTILDLRASRAAAAARASSCMPGSTQACLGPAACNGAQACEPGGKSWSACDCGGARP